ncbi:MAG: isoprenylcysteine carboxylmethyltransferase family protein, partial [Acidimicrobiales bacterium]
MVDRQRVTSILAAGSAAPVLPSLVNPAPIWGPNSGDRRRRPVATVRSGARADGRRDLHRQWASLVLGRFFTVDVRDHAEQTVVERGPYRWVRHPPTPGWSSSSWASGWHRATGVARNARPGPTAGLVERIRSEERSLLTRLGETY